MLKQDALGRLTGKKFTIKELTGEDEDGKPIYEEKVIYERVKSFDTLKFAITFLFGEPGKMNNLQPDDYETPVFVMDELPE
jgi:hypothetical protein